jgi:cell division protein FtsB
MRLSRVARLWAGAFIIWGILLSGVFSPMGGSPGIIQAFRLNTVLNQKQIELAAIESEIEKIEVESAHLEKNPRAQEREVRKTLGYVGSDEIIFDFSSARTAVLRN